MTKKTDSESAEVIAGGASFRRSTPGDEPAIRRILEQANLSFQAIPLSGSTGTSPAAEQQFAPESYVCAVGGQIVGVLQWTRLGLEAEICDVAIAEGFRRKGLATFLLSEFLTLARSAGIRQVFLEVRASNSAATALYERLGFTVSGRRPAYYRDPVESAVLMKLSIDG